MECKVPDWSGRATAAPGPVLHNSHPVTKYFRREKYLAALCFLHILTRAFQTKLICRHNFQLKGFVRFEFFQFLSSWISSGRENRKCFSHSRDPITCMVSSTDIAKPRLCKNFIFHPFNTNMVRVREYDPVRPTTCDVRVTSRPILAENSLQYPRHRISPPRTKKLAVGWFCVKSISPVNSCCGRCCTVGQNCGAQ